VEAEIKASFPQAEVELVRGSGGVFDIKRDGALVFSKDKNVCGGFPKEGEIAELLINL